MKLKTLDTPKAQDKNCDAHALKNIIGQPYSTVDQLPKHRLIRPGYKYTQQYKPSRLNIVMDENGTITAVRCG